MADKDTIQMIRKDITERLRDRDNHDCIEAANEIERLRKERDEARLQTGRILNEIDCRIEHGADSNGHLEGIRSLFKDSKKSQDVLDRLAELDQELGLI